MLLELVAVVVVVVHDVLSISSSRLVSGTGGNLERVLRISQLFTVFKPFKDSALSSASFIRAVNLAFASISVIFYNYNIIINIIHKFRNQQNY